MPKKTNFLKNYFAVNKAKPFDSNFQKFLTICPKGTPISTSCSMKSFEKTVYEWLKPNLLPENFFNLYFNNESSLFSFINCDEFFANKSAFDIPFKIFLYNGIEAVLLFDENDINIIKTAINEEEPVQWYKWLKKYDRKLYLFGNYLWSISETEALLENNNLRLLFLDYIDKERKKVERLNHKFSGIAGKTEERRRESISEQVRIFVWRRDEGKCVKCGSQKNLEYDHIIPFSKGGSNTERNIQLLCEACNREKRDKI